MSDPDIAVLRMGTHGLTMAEYADKLRTALPDREIRLAKTPAEERELITSASIATGSHLSEDLLASATDLRYFACTYAGYEHLPLAALEDRDVTVTNAAGIHAPNIAEGVIGQILVFARRLDEGWRRASRREWRHFQAHELAGSTVTIVGLGSIGTAVAERLEGFDVNTIGIRYSPEKGGPTDEVVGFDRDDVHAALARTDYLVLATPLTETTRGLIGEEELITLESNAVIINVARGEVIDTDALISELQRQGIRGAALDVTDPEPLPEDHPLWTFENVHITPHNAGHTPLHWDRMVDIVAENVERIDETGAYTDLRNQVLP